MSFRTRWSLLMCVRLVCDASINFKLYPISYFVVHNFLFLLSLVLCYPFARTKLFGKLNLIKRITLATQKWEIGNRDAICLSIKFNRRIIVTIMNVIKQCVQHMYLLMYVYVIA